MKKFILNALSTTLGILCAAFMMLIMFICIMTPEKTKHGTYTDVYKYWTDDVYVCRNFECPVKKGV